MSGNNSSVLAIFARAPVVGKVKTRLAQTVGHERATELYRAMLQDVLSGAQQACGVSSFAFEIVVFYSPDDAFEIADNSLRPFWDGARQAQSEGDLGEKLRDCFAFLQREGWRKIVVIGSDAPDLPPRSLAQAFATLENCDLVFGPASDGGFYLVGASREIGASLFSGVRWSDASTLDDVWANAKSDSLQVEMLPIWRDVDDKGDLRALELRLKNGESVAPQTLRVLDLLRSE